MEPNTLEEYELAGLSWASLVFIRVLSDHAQGLEPKVLSKSKLHIPLGFVFVIEPARRDPKYKLAGGHRKEGVDETPLHTAVREMYGETGIRIPPERFRYCEKRLHKRGDHYKCLFLVEIFEHESRTMHNFDDENEGEHPEFLPPLALEKRIRSNEVMVEHLQWLAEQALYFSMASSPISIA